MFFGFGVFFNRILSDLHDFLYTPNICTSFPLFAPFYMELVTHCILGGFFIVYLLYFIFWCIRSPYIAKYQQYSNISRNNMAKSIIKVGQDHSALCCGNWSTEKSSWMFPEISNFHTKFLKWKFCFLYFKSKEESKTGLV